jgi:hypothetical protein
MGDQDYAKLAGRDLATLIPQLALPDAAAEIARPCKTVPEALLALEAGGHPLGAIRLLSHALPGREAVWWACMCAQHTAPGVLAEPDRRAREAAEAWVRQPAEPARRQAMARAQETGFGTPEAWAAVAVFWSTGSMAPEGQPDVPPPAHLAGTAVAGAVALASVRGDVERREARLRRFLESGRDIAAGGAGRLAPEEA